MRANGVAWRHPSRPEGQVSAVNARFSSSTRSVLSQEKSPSPGPACGRNGRRRGSDVDRPVQPADARGCRAGERFISSFTTLASRSSLTSRRCREVDIDRERLGDADRIADLDGAVVRQPGGHDVLRHIARGIGGRAVDLGRVLAGERAAAMRGRAAIGVDDDLAAGQACIAVRPADHELAGRVDVEFGFRRNPAGAAPRTIGPQQFA